MKFFIYKFSTFLIPFYVIIISYFILDPFKVLYSYTNYYENTFVQLNRDYISTELLLKKNRDINKTNSYKFGSSRTLGFSINSWKNKLPIEANCFSYDASNESIFGIERKINLIDSLGIRINNVLIIICPDVTFKDKNNEYWSLKHPIISNSKYKFYSKFFFSYLTDGFFIKYIDFLLFNKYRDYMMNSLDIRKTEWDSVTNNIYPMELENKINKDSSSYYSNHYVFYERPLLEKRKEKQIDAVSIKRLIHIKEILTKNKTNYKIIISPLYDQQKINPSDLLILQSIFEKENVFNYSGKNSITDNKYNYLENSHFKKSVGEKILNEIYHNN